MLIEQDAQPQTVEACASRLLADLPHDQAIGLRLIALARAAAAVHLAQQSAPDRHDPLETPLDHSQASNLLRLFRPEGRA